MLSFPKHLRSHSELQTMWDAAVSLRMHIETGSTGMSSHRKFGLFTMPKSLLVSEPEIFTKGVIAYQRALPPQSSVQPHIRTHPPTQMDHSVSIFPCFSRAGRGKQYAGRKCHS